MPAPPSALMVFAAGLGTRMGELSRDRPKPLIEVAGRPLLDHALSLAEEAGTRTVVVNAHHHADQITKHLRGRRPAISHEPDLLDTGGGLRAALPLLGPGPVFTLNSDAAWSGPNPLSLLAEAWQEPMRALLLLVPRDQARGHLGQGDFTLGPDGRLRPGRDHVFTGAQIVRTDQLAAIPERAFSLRLLWQRLAVQGGLNGLVYPGGWCDVGHPAGITEAERMLSQAP